MVGGFILSLAVVLTTNAIVGKESDWAWRIPFLFSLSPLAVLLWIRMKLSECLVFQVHEKEAVKRPPIP